MDASVQMVQKQGNLQLEVRFAEALPESINTILYARFPGEIRIDQARTIRLIMKTLDVEESLMSDEMTTMIAGGVYAADRLPRTIPDRSLLYIANTDPILNLDVTGWLSTLEKSKLNTLILWERSPKAS